MALPSGAKGRRTNYGGLGFSPAIPIPANSTVVVCENLSA